MTPKIKICGLTSPNDARILNEEHVELAGFVLFFPKSRRKKVAVTVSPTLEQAMEIAAAGFDYLQAHGTLDSAILEQVRMPILQAANVKTPEDLKKLSDHPSIAGYVFDGQDYGGGKVFDWSYLEGCDRKEKLLILAGGLSADNVAGAIAQVHPDIVDISSGVELPGIETPAGLRSPGKDPEKVRRFVRAVRGL